MIALAVRARQPAARIAIVERDQALGGNHTRTLIAWPGRAFAGRARVPTRILTPDDVGLGR